MIALVCDPRRIHSGAELDIATQPDLKQRTVSALKGAGETAIDEFVLENKYLKVVKAAVKGWLQTGN